MIEAGIYITFKDIEQYKDKFISFNNLDEWKSFTSTHSFEDIECVEVKSFSLNNSQPVSHKFFGDEFEGLEFTKILFSQMGSPDFTCTAMYIPSRNGNYRVLFNENGRLIFEGNDGNPNRTKRYSIERRL